LHSFSISKRCEKEKKSEQRSRRVESCHVTLHITTHHARRSQSIFSILTRVSIFFFANHHGRVVLVCFLLDPPFVFTETMTNSVKASLVNCWIVLILSATMTQAFISLSSNSFFRPVTLFQRTSSRSACSRLNMCICVNCALVTSCTAYHFVETKHDQPHMTETPTFTPRDGSPTIHVNIRSIRSDTDRQAEVQRMWREHETETEKAQSDSDSSDNLHGETVYDLTPVTTYEYDVVKCQDYVEDLGNWVRNMPLEIRNANPNFVPS
jgi:hypothetical protein